MSDIFGYDRKTSPDIVFSSDDTILTFGGSDMAGKLVQGWSITYAQAVQELYEIGSSNMYWVRGRPVGEGELQRILGSANVKLLPNDAYDVCNGGVIFNIDMQPGACAGSVKEGVTLTLSGVVVTQLGMTTSAADVMINQGLRFKFATLSTSSSAVG